MLAEFIRRVRDRESDELPHIPNIVYNTLPQNRVPHESRIMYRFESRSIPVGRWPRSLYARTQRHLLRFALAAVWFSVFVTAGRLATETVDPWASLTALVLQLAFWMSVLDKFLVDFIALLTGLDSVSSDFREGRWDQIAITDVSLQRLLQAKYAVAQVQAWRTMTYVVGVRVFVLVILLMTGFFAPLILSGETPFVSIRIRSLDELVGWLLTAGAAAGMALIYVMEPIWRLRALAGASIAISSRTLDVGAGMIYAALSFFSIWWIQVSAVLVSLVAVFFPLSLLGSVMPNVDVSAATFAAGIGLAYVVVLGLTIRGSYMSFGRRRLTAAWKRLHKKGAAP